MTKKLLMGNEAFAHAALESGVNVVAGYPGTPSSEVIETIVRLHKSGKAKDVYVEWSTNEKAALEVAAAASMSGARALFTCKQVGLNVASDALMSLNYVGVRGGLVIFVADDPGPISSQTEQDTRRFAAFAKVPVLDPATPEQGVQMIKEAFRLSEEHGTPVIVRPTTRIDHASTFFDVQNTTRARKIPDGGFERDPEEWVIFPKRSYRAHGEINKRLQSMAHEFTYDPAFTCFNAGFERLSNGMARPLPPMTAGFENRSRSSMGASDPATHNEDGINAAPSSFDEDDATGSNNQSASATDSYFTGRNIPTLGIVTGGVSTQYAQEALQMIEEEANKAGVEIPSFRFMQIGTPYPFPRRLVGRFLKDLSDVLVLEELDSVIEEELLKAAAMSFLSPNVHGKLTDEANDRGENSTEDAVFRIAYFFDKYRKGTLPVYEDGTVIKLTEIMERVVGPNALLTYDGKLPLRAPVLCAGCPHRGSFYSMKKAVSKLKIAREDAIFCGDIGCYTLGNAYPLDAVDTCLCMGAGITMAQGFSVTNPNKKNIAFVGDSTFFASGMTGVANAVYNQHDITLCILDNSTTAMTGSQPHPGTGVTLMGPKSEPIDIEATLKALGVKHIFKTDPLDVDKAQSTCMDALEVTEPNAVIFKSPCVWLQPFGDPAMVNMNLCTGCKKCITEIGCPAIAFDPDAKGAKSGRRGQAYIDESQCNGCGLCLQVCPFNAIYIITEEERELYESARGASNDSNESAPGSVGNKNKRRKKRVLPNSEIGDDLPDDKVESEPDEDTAIEAEDEESFVDAVSNGYRTGFTSTNIYGESDHDSVESGRFRGGIGLDAIGSDFDGFVDSLVSGLSARGGKMDANASSTNGQDDAASDPIAISKTFHYSMKDRPYWLPKIERDEATANHTKGNEDDDARSRSDVHGEEEAISTVEGRSSDEDTLDVLAALNSGVYLEVSDGSNEQEKEDHRERDSKREEDEKRPKRGDRVEKEKPKSSAPKQSRWGGRG